jgi:hypothetical protein
MNVIKNIYEKYNGHVTIVIAIAITIKEIINILYPESEWIKRHSLYFLIAILVLAAIILQTHIIGSKVMGKIDILYQNSQFSLTKIKNLAKQFARSSNYYRLLVLDIPIQDTEEKSRCLHGESYKLMAYNKYDYIRNVFTKIIMRLDSYDTYCSLSTLNFWAKDDNSNSAEKFLMANFDARMHNGVTIKRIVLINKNIFDEPQSYRKEIRMLETIIALFTKIKQENHVSEINTRFYLFDPVSESEFTTVPPHAYIIRNLENGQEDSVLIKPNESARVPSIEFYFSDEKTALDAINRAKKQFKSQYERQTDLLTFDELAAKKSQFQKKNLIPEYTTDRFIYTNRKLDFHVVRTPLNYQYNPEHILSSIIDMRSDDKEFICIVRGEHFAHFKEDWENKMPTKNKEKYKFQKVFDLESNIMWEKWDFELDLSILDSGYVSFIASKFSERNISILFYSLDTGFSVFLPRKTPPVNYQQLTNDFFELGYEMHDENDIDSQPTH